MTNNDTLPNTNSVIEKDEVKEDKKVDTDESSGDSVVETKLNEFVNRSELSKLDIRALVVRCSACGRQINHHSRKDIKKHRRLGVITCKECYDFYGSSEFSQDESGYNYCTWCGNGGKLIVCDYCPNGFCSACIRRNFGRAEISVTTTEGWKCYCCNRSRLKPKVKFCNMILRYDKNCVKKEKKAVPVKTKNALTEKWLQDAFDDSEEACKTFHKKMSQLKAIGVNKSKSLKHIEKKMEQVINTHRENLKKVVNCLSQHYLEYIDLKNKMEAERLANKANGDIIEILLDDDKNGHSDKVDDKNGLSDEMNKAESECVSVNDDCIILDDTCDENILNQNEQSPSMLENQEDSSKYDDEKLKAKMSLLASSSDSEGLNSESLLQGQDKTSVKSEDSGIKDSDMKDPDIKDPDIKDPDIKDSDIKDSDIKDSDIKDSDIKEGSESPKDESSTVRRKLNFSDSESDFDVNSKKKNKPRLSETYANLDLSDDAAAVEKEQEEYDPKNDPKLKLLPEVNVIRCDHLLENGETVVNVSETCKDICADNDDEGERLDKLIDSLCKFPVSKKTKTNEKPKSSTLPKQKVSSKKIEAESSSSISLSSGDELKILPSDKKIVKIAKAKEDLMNSDSSSNLDSEDEEEEIKKKTSKPKKKNSDSDDDFQPRKKRKFDKLLHGPILSDDEKSPKEKKERKLKLKKKRIMSSEEENNLKKESNKSNSTTTSDSDGDFKSKKQSRKRKRIKRVESSSEDDGKGDTPSGKGRKNIKRIISQKNLADETKEAQLEEKERKRRIDERQMLYNKIEDTSVDGKEIITRKMVLEVDKESKEEIVEIHPDLVCKLKPHQVNGVKFMWECTIEAVKYLDKPGSGCILAHCMGLGKTLQVIAFIHTCLNNSYVKKHISRAMVICPYNVALNWAAEFDYWLDDVEGSVLVHQLAPAKSNHERLDILRYWFEDGGVLIISYDIFRRLSAEKIQKVKNKEKKELHSFLLDPGPDIVVCDEGHILRNETAAISKATSKLRTRRRVVLTGTPLQNNLKEYHCMLSFVKPNLLGTVKEFRNRFVNPIMNGQYDDSTDYDVKLMKKRIHILHKLLEGCVHRCDYSALTKFLPPKHEFVISVKLSEIQMKMYECYLENLTVAKKGIKCSGSTLFVDFNNLRCIWNHPYICHVSHEKNEYKRLFREEEEEEEEFIDDASTSTSSSHNSTSDDDKLIEDIKESNKRKDYRTRSKQDVDDEIQDITEQGSKRWYDEYISEEDRSNVQLSGKMVLLMEILKECESIRDKVILFSQSLLALDAIEEILSFSSSTKLTETDKFQDAIGTWYKGMDYFRMDGATSAEFRKSYIDMFNDPNNDRARLFLISTKAGSLGTNLIGANRVIIFDTSWNPSHDVQAIFRAYRFGQVKPVYIYRLLAQGTMEEKIYDRQVTKLSLSCRVVDEQQIDRHFSAADLAELYTFDRNFTSNRPTPLVPKDRLLAELLIRNKDWIVTYHEHDSLLQSQREEDLTEEERQAAWTEYENEREGKTVPPSGLNEDELNIFAREPDFTNADYEGKIIPDLKTIIDNLYERLRSQIPGLGNTAQFRKQLLCAVYKVRQAFQEKHVKTLRMKQEFIAHGTVPNAINKYIDELSQALKSTGEYIIKLQTAIAQEEAKTAQLQEHYRRQQAAYMQQVRMQNANVNRKPGPTIVIRGALPQQNMAQYSLINQRFVRVTRPTIGGIRIFPNSIPTFNRNQNITVTAQPTITEVDDSASVSVNDSSIKNGTNAKSTVVIEEIS